jgi:hypothetical protein
LLYGSVQQKPAMQVQSSNGADFNRRSLLGRTTPRLSVSRAYDDLIEGRRVRAVHQARARRTQVMRDIRRRQRIDDPIRPACAGSLQARLQLFCNTPPQFTHA